MKKPLASIIILSYKNYHYIYEALNSVIEQDYGNMEIIISNDASNDFDETAIKKYFKKNKAFNIKRVVINNNPKNLGTVKNINKAIKLSKGKYIIIFAADDAMYNSNVVTKLINAFDTLPKKELIVTSQIGMFDTKLKRLIQLFVSEKNKEKIKKLTPKKLFAEMTTQCILPGSGTCYKREIFKKYHIFDEKYVLVEDYSSALKLSRLGVRYNYFDFISFKHRDGGISHGNILGDTSAGNKYDLDIFNILKFEILPYLNLLDKKQKKSFIRIYRDHEWRYSYNYKYKNGTKAERRKFVSKNFGVMIYGFFYNIYRELKDQFKGKKFKVFLLGLFLLTVYSFNIDYGSSILSVFNMQQFSKISDIINRTIGFLGLFLTISSIILTIYVFIKKYILQIYRFIKFIF
jgi:glycosyltransferase involved in cell wall biosynthesis